MLSLVAASADLLFCLLVRVNGTVVQHATMWYVDQLVNLHLLHIQLVIIMIVIMSTKSELHLYANQPSS
jgi:hypothetical protein